MDTGFFSHLLLWVVGGIALVGLVGTTGALFSLGRTTNDKKH